MNYHQKIEEILNAKTLPQAEKIYLEIRDKIINDAKSSTCQSLNRDQAKLLRYTYANFSKEDVDKIIDKIYNIVDKERKLLEDEIKSLQQKILDLETANTDLHNKAIQAENRTCEWKNITIEGYDFDERYETACGETITLSYEDKPLRYKCCTNCGKKIEVK